MNIYTFLSLGYDLLDHIWLSEKGINPRNVIQDIIPNASCRILDMCCGTFTNGLMIAKNKPECRVYGIDRSAAMLREAKRKIRKNDLRNVRVKCLDATDTGIKEKTFDYIVIGLVLHECSPELRKNILEEAYRLLKDDGKLIILEWEKQTGIRKRIKYAPLYVLEALNCKSFKNFFLCDKEVYFKEHGFKMTDVVHCNYSSVMSLKKLI